MTAILEPYTAHPYFAVELHFRRGTAGDPIGQEGLTHLAAELLMRGTRRQTRADFDATVEGLGAGIEVMAGRDDLAISADGLSRSMETLIDLVGEMLVEPRLDEEELERLKRQTIAEIAERQDSDEELAQHVFYQVLYGSNPFGRPTKGTRASLAGLTLSHLRERLPTLLARERLLIGASGDVSPARLESALRPWLERLPATSVPEAPSVTLPNTGQRRVVLIDKPERTQTQIWIGVPGPSVHHPDFLPLMIGNTVFGGTFTARLSREIREKRGWSYGANSYLFGLRDHGALCAHFYPATKDAVPALRLGLRLLERFAAQGVNRRELAFAKSYLVNGFPFRLESARKRLDERLRLELLGLSQSHLDTFVDRVGAVTLADVNRAIATHVRPDSARIVIVCTAKTLRKPIERLVGSAGLVQVHPFDVEWRHGQD